MRELELKRQSLIRHLVNSDDKSSVQRLLQQKKAIKHRFEALEDITRVISNLALWTSKQTVIMSQAESNNN